MEMRRPVIILDSWMTSHYVTDQSMTNISGMKKILWILLNLFDIDQRKLIKYLIKITSGPCWH